MTSPHKKTETDYDQLNHDKDQNPFYDPNSSSNTYNNNENPTTVHYPTVLADQASPSAPVPHSAPVPVPVPAPAPVPVPVPSDEDKKKWGTQVMGAPAVPSTHPDNQKAASSWAPPASGHLYEQPYVQFDPVDHKPFNNPFEPVIHMFNSWSSKADSISRNVWHNLKTGQSVPGTAWGKMNLTAKAMTSGGFEALFKQIFAPSDPNEKLLKTFACYLSTSTGPVAGTLYLSTARLAFCSDRPLSFVAPSGQEAWSYYKVIVPLGNVGTVNPVVLKQNPPEKYIQIVTVDGHDFWFMGFVNYEKACHHLLNSVSDFRAAENVPQPPPPVVA